MCVVCVCSVCVCVSVFMRGGCLPFYAQPALKWANKPGTVIPVLVVTVSSSLLLLMASWTYIYVCSYIL